MNPSLTIKADESYQQYQEIMNGLWFESRPLIESLGLNLELIFEEQQQPISLSRQSLWYVVNQDLPHDSAQIVISRASQRLDLNLFRALLDCAIAEAIHPYFLNQSKRNKPLSLPENNPVVGGIAGRDEQLSVYNFAIFLSSEPDLVDFFYRS